VCWLVSVCACNSVCCCFARVNDTGVTPHLYIYVGSHAAVVCSAIEWPRSVYDYVMAWRRKAGVETETVRSPYCIE